MKTIPRRLEKDVQAEIVGNLAALGFMVNDLSQPRPTMLPLGLPDLHVAHRRFGELWIEVKAPHRRTERFGGLSTDQYFWHVNATAAGIHVIVAYGTDDVLAYLKTKGLEIR